MSNVIKLGYNKIDTFIPKYFGVNCLDMMFHSAIIPTTFITPNYFKFTFETLNYARKDRGLPAFKKRKKLTTDLNDINAKINDVIKEYPMPEFTEKIKKISDSTYVTCNGIKFPAHIYDKFKHDYKYNKNKDMKQFNNLVTKILTSYDALGGFTNMHLSVPGHIYKELDNNGFTIELFASSINHNLKKFCSLFPAYEKYFGSIGSFFEITIPPNGKYSCNPPYDNEVMALAMEKISNVKNAEYYIVIPIWDNKTRIEMNKELPHYKKKYIITDYGDYTPYTLLHKFRDEGKYEWYEEKRYHMHEYLYKNWWSNVNHAAAPTYEIKFKTK